MLHLQGEGASPQGVGQHIGGPAQLAVVRGGHFGQGPNLHLGQDTGTVALPRAAGLVEAE